jgi:TetR/AcrR family transcriptional regulator, tetracycline repressor protein
VPRRTLTRASIVEAAFAVLERDGLDGVTARAIAAELGVQAGAIYYHLPDMAAVRDEMATDLQRRMGGRAVPAAWQDLLRETGRSIRSVLLAHRDGARLFAGRRLRDPALLLEMEAPLARLTEAGLGLAQAAWVLQSVLDLTVGFVIEEQHRESGESGSYDPAARARAVGADAPLTAAASGPMQADADQRFAFALGLLIDGADVALRAVRPS